MVRSMFAAIAGLKTHQSKMDVIGNNIANVNTPGYKTMSATFKDSMYMTTIQPAGPSNIAGGTGGINASQVGYGAVLSAIKTNFTTSSPGYTGNNLDLMISGTGFFMVGPKWDDDAKTPGDVYLSRVGEFGIVNGYLTDSAGNYVYGNPTTDITKAADGTITYTIDGMTIDPATGVATLNAGLTELKPLKIPGPLDNDGKGPGDAGYLGENSWESYSIDKNGKITGTSSDGLTYVLGYVPLINVDNPNGMTKVEGYYYKLGDENGAAGKGHIVSAGGASGELLSGYLEMANVDLAQQFADMITTQRGFQANSKMITVTDEMLQELVNMKR